MRQLLIVVISTLLICFEVGAKDFNFSGTVWKTFDITDGDIMQIEFHESGRCAYTNIKSQSGNEGKSYSISTSACRWTQFGNTIRYDFNNNYMVRIGELVGSNKIKGTYTSKSYKGETHSFSGELISMRMQEPDLNKPKKKNIDDSKIVAAASGTGFFVSNNGSIITNHHVIDECTNVKVNFKGSSVTAKIIAIDQVNDIAILKTNIKPDNIFAVSNEDVSLLEDVIVAGYPLGKKVSSAIKTHKGVVTSLAGAGDNYSNFQTDAAINQGNSGGPIINQKGNVVGVAVATWVEEGVQGVHFGIKSSTLKTFANANGLKFLSPSTKELSNKELGKIIIGGTVYLECYMTIAKIKTLIANSKNQKAFFEKYK